MKTDFSDVLLIIESYARKLRQIDKTYRILNPQKEADEVSVENAKEVLKALFDLNTSLHYIERR
jgi:hypothetical protein